MNVSLQKVKIVKSMSHETNCFTADILVDGKKIGTVENRGCGGCNSYYWTNRPMGKKLEDWAKKQKLEFKFEQLDQIIDQLLTEEDVKKQIKRWTKTKTVFRLKGDSEGSWRTVNAKFEPKVKTWLIEKYGKKIEVIANETVK